MSKDKRFLKHNETLINKVSTCVIFLGCFSGLCLQGYKCIQQYLDGPQGVEISTHEQSELDFPSFTICPRKNHGYNDTKLGLCGLSQKKLFRDGKFVSPNSSSFCTEPEKLWKSYDFADYDIKNIGVRTTTDKKIHFGKVFDWEKIPHRMGSCYTLILPTNLTNDGINTLIFIFKNVSFEIELFIHPKGLFDLRASKMTIEYVEIQPHEGARHMVTYQQRQVLDFGKKPCNNSEHYNYQKCMEETVFNQTMEKVGCTTPFVQDLSKVCKDVSKEKEAMEIYDKIYMNPPCLYPCKYLSNFGLTFSPFKKDEEKGKETFYFLRYTQKYKSVYTYNLLDLFAALGGYIGFFLGFSIFHLRDAISKLIHKLII